MARIRVRVRVTPMEPMTAKGAHRMVSATQAIIYPPEAATCSGYRVRIRVRVRVGVRVRG